MSKIITEAELRKKIKLILEETKFKILAEQKLANTAKDKLEELKKIDPNITDLTKMFIINPGQYKKTVTSALKRAGGHIPIAADMLGVSERTLRRHLKANFSKKEFKLAKPGPDKAWDLEKGTKVKK
jgi:DNA-binding NtrC family response regulator